jgi:hypothetical protein
LRDGNGDKIDAEMAAVRFALSLSSRTGSTWRRRNTTAKKGHNHTHLCFFCVTVIGPSGASVLHAF